MTSLIVPSRTLGYGATVVVALVTLAAISLAVMGLLRRFPYDCTNNKGQPSMYFIATLLLMFMFPPAGIVLGVILFFKHPPA